MPDARMLDPLDDAALGQFGKVEPGGEMIALAVDSTTAFDAGRQRGEKDLETEHGGVVEGVAFLRPRQAQQCNVAAALGGKRGRQLLPDHVCGFLRHFLPLNGRIVRIPPRPVKPSRPPADSLIDNIRRQADYAGI